MKKEYPKLKILISQEKVLLFIHKRYEGLHKLFIYSMCGISQLYFEKAYKKRDIILVNNYGPNKGERLIMPNPWTNIFNNHETREPNTDNISNNNYFIDIFKSITGYTPIKSNSNGEYLIYFQYSNLPLIKELPNEISSFLNKICAELANSIIILCADSFNNINKLLSGVFKDNNARIENDNKTSIAHEYIAFCITYLDRICFNNAGPVVQVYFGYSLCAQLLKQFDDLLSKNDDYFIFVKYLKKEILFRILDKNILKYAQIIDNYDPNNPHKNIIQVEFGKNISMLLTNQINAGIIVFFSTIMTDWIKDNCKLELFNQLKILFKKYKIQYY